jgi:PAS domain S-box-containing protein
VRQDPLDSFGALIEASPLPFWQCDPDGRLVYLNPAWERALGYAPQEMLGQPLSAYLWDGGALDARGLAELVGESTGEGHDVALRHRLGHAVTMRVRCATRCDDSGAIQTICGTAEDVTLQRRFEADLLQSQTRFRRLFEDMPLAFCWSDPAFRFLDANPAFIRMFGYSLEELRTMTFRDITASDPQPDESSLRRLMRGDLPVYRTTKRYVSRSGEMLWGLLTVSAVRDEQGGFLHFLAGVADITEMKRTEAALRASQAFLDESQRIGRVGSFEYDVGQDRWTSSLSLDLMLGIEASWPRDLAGALALVHPDDRPRVEHAVKQRAMAQRLPFDQEFRLSRMKDSNEVWVHAHGRFLAGTERPGRLIGTVQDTTERRRAEWALRASEQRYRTLVDQINVGVFQTRPDGQFVLANRAFATAAGCESVEEFMLRSVREYYANPSDRDALLEELQCEGSVRNREILSRRRDGSDYPASVSAVLLRDPQGRPESILGVIEDISSRKKTEAALQRTQHLESLGLLAGGIAHDFNNLLAGIFGFVELAMDLSTEPEVKELLAETGQVQARARALTQQLLTFAKGGQPTRRVGPIATLLRDTVRFATSGTRVGCCFDIADDLGVVSYDEHQIAQAIDNIVINAVQAMPLGGTLEVHASNVRIGPHQYSALAAGDYIAIAIRDQGIGIAPEHWARVFDPFFTTKQGGSGLGLATAYSIVKRHDGYIDVESKPTAGSTFTVYLPRVAGQAEQARESVALAHRGRGTALIVDDERSVLIVLERMLRSMGYDCVVAEDGEQAVARFVGRQTAGQPLAFAILDLTMPGGRSGVELNAELRALGAEMPTFAASGYSDDPVIARPHEFGFADSLRKPFTRRALADMLSRALPDDSNERRR